MSKRSLRLSLLFLFALPAVANAEPHWRQWGGPNRDFKIDGVDLAESWPESGPPILWKQDLGDGYSALAFDSDRLFTLYRKGGKEFVVCLDAKSGKKLWEHGYEAPISDKLYKKFGVGPRAMPLVDGDRVYTVGINGKLLSIEKATGKVAWTKEYVADMGGSEITFGCASSPILYGETIILPIGGEKHAVVAFDKKSGKVAWRSSDFKASYATPALIRVDGQDQLVAFMATHVIGMNPRDGGLKWSVALENQWGTNCTTPVYGSDNLLFVTTEETGSKLLKLSTENEKTTVEEIWFERRPQIVFTNAIRLGNHIYGSFGVNTAPFSALSLKDGSIAWRDRRFNKASSVYADEKLIILDENGLLALATVTPEDIEVHSKVQLLENNAWTVPTLIGTKLFARDQKSVVSLELGKPSEG